MHQMDNRGISIAEGDVLVLCIRLFSELLLGRYALPPPTHTDTLLARHAAGMFAHARDVLARIPGGHRDETFNRLLLPRSELAVTSLGHARAYACALDAGVPAPLLRLFECYIVKLDFAWYAEHEGVMGEAFRAMEDEAVRAALPHLQAYVDRLDARRWVTAPILNDASWSKWLDVLPVHTGFEEQDRDLVAPVTASSVETRARL